MSSPGEEKRARHMEEPTSPCTEETKFLNGTKGPEESFEINVSSGPSNGYSKPVATTPRKVPQWFIYKLPCYWILISLTLFAALVAVIAGLAIYFLSRCKSEPLCPAQCPTEWILVNDSCYFLSDSKKNWTDSQQFCNEHGGSLVMIIDNTKNDLNKLNTQDDFWIGLRRDQKNWKWNDGRNYTEEVKEYHNDGRLNCAHLSGGIIALDCATSRRFICSKSIRGVNT